MPAVYANEALIPSLRALWKKAFGDTDEFLDLFFSTAYAPERCRCIAGGDAVQSVLYWFDCTLDGEKIAYIYAVATDPDCRGRGLCRDLMADTMEILRSRGYAAAVLLPQEEWLIQMYAGMGFAPCTRVTEQWYPAGEPVAARRIDETEYAALRRALLPAGGVIQEGENLSFLAGMTQLWAGEGFLAAVMDNEGELWCPEFLGDPAAAPGVLAALRCSEGRFRTPGDTSPFAMFHPLTGEAQPPRHLALAFD